MRALLSLRMPKTVSAMLDLLIAVGFAAYAAANKQVNAAHVMLVGVSLWRVIEVAPEEFLAWLKRKVPPGPVQ